MRAWHWQCVALIGSVLLAAPAATGQELTGTLKKINDSNTLAIGHREASAPFSFVDDSKAPVGYAIDLCARVAEEVKAVLKKPDLKVVYVPVNPQTRIAKVMDGSIDMECGSTTNTLRRQQQVDFSAVYFTTGTRLLVRRALGAREIEDLDGRTLGVISGSTNEAAVKAVMAAGKPRNLKLVEIKDYADGLAAVEDNRVDAFATDDIVLYGLLGKSPKKADLQVTGRLLSYDPYGIMMRRDDSAFRLVVNRSLARTFRSGEIEGIYDKWFTPMGVPLSPLLKAGFALQAIPE